MSLGRVITASQAALVARHGVLVSLDTAVAEVAKETKARALLVLDRGTLLPVEGEVRCGDNLDKVHEVVVGVVGLLVGAVEGVAVVVSPGVGALRHLLGDGVGQLGTEAEGVDDVREVVLGIVGSLPVVLEVVDVHVSVAEGAARSQVEVSNDFVHAEATLNAAALPALLLQLLGVMLARALLDVFSLTERPRGLRVRFSDFLASVTAAGLLRVRRRRGTVTGAAVVGIQVLGSLVAGVAFGLCQSCDSGRCLCSGAMGNLQTQGLDVDDAASLLLRAETNLVDAVHDTVLLLSGNIHNIEGKKFAGHLGEGDVEMDLHALACTVAH